MVIFFFVVGLEIKYELVNGDLRDPKTAALPIVAAIGGMVVPAALYVAFIRPAVTGPRAGASRWRPTSPSPSACSACSVAGSPRRRACSC